MNARGKYECACVWMLEDGRWLELVEMFVSVLVCREKKKNRFVGHEQAYLNNAAYCPAGAIVQVDIVMVDVFHHGECELHLLDNRTACIAIVLKIARITEALDLRVLG